MLILAAGGWELFIWLLVFLFYGLAQLMQRGRRDSRKSTPPPGRRPRPVEEELREFIETLTGEEEEEETSMPPPAPVPPAREVSIPPRLAPPSLLPLSDVMRSEERVLSRPRQAPVRPPRRARPRTSRFEDVAVATFPTVSPKSFLVGMNSLKMPLLRVNLHLPHSQHTSELRPRFDSPRALKQGMISHIVLGPPRALHEDWKRF